MQPHEVEGRRPDPGNDNGPKRRTTLWLLVAIATLVVAIGVNLIQRVV